MTYPITRNGWTDSGKPVNHGQKKCPNCGSSNFVETLSREICYSCGLECDYWGGGANKVYDAMSARRQQEAERLLKERLDIEFGHDLGENE